MRELVNPFVLVERLSEKKNGQPTAFLRPTLSSAEGGRPGRRRHTAAADGADTVLTTETPRRRGIRITSSGGAAQGRQ